MIGTSLRQKAALCAVGILACLLVLEIALRLAGMTIVALQRQRNFAACSQEAFRIMCVGESTTAMGGEFSYPAQLEKALDRSGCDIRFTVINAGLINARSYTVVDQLEENIARYKPRMVVSMLGINDVGKYVHVSHPTFGMRVRDLFVSLRVYKVFKKIALNIRSRREKKPQLLKQDIVRNGGSDILGRARYLLSKGDWDGVETLLRAEIEKDPGYAAAYLELGRAYKVQGKKAEAETYLLKAVALAPRVPDGYFELAILYRNEARPGSYQRSAAMFAKLIELAPDNPWYTMELAGLYRSGNELQKAAAMFERTLELDPTMKRAYVELGWIARLRKEYDKGIAIIQKGIFVLPNESGLYGELALLYRESGRPREAAQYARRARDLERSLLRQNTMLSYARIGKILADRGIVWVAMQYPLRDIGELQKLVGDRSGVIFVDNSVNFQAALSRGRYDDYFTDLFAGDFGHCTPLGNAMIAENLARQIIRRYGKRSCL